MTENQNTTDLKCTAEAGLVDRNVRHSEGFWRLDVHSTGDDENVFIHADGVGCIASMLKHNPYEIDYSLINANASRIVACVNACAGLSLEDLDLCATLGATVVPNAKLSRATDAPNETADGNASA